MSALLEERRMRSIYEELDNGRTEQAYSLLQAHMKRSPKTAHLPIIQAVRCLCLHRLHQDPEALDVFEQMIVTAKDDKPVKSGSQAKVAAAPTEVAVKALKPGEHRSIEVGDVLFDNNVLQCLAFALKPLKQYKALQTLHQNAWNRNPKDIDHGTQVFTMSIRLKEWKRAGEAASKLWDESKDPKTAHWGAMCSYLQTTVHCAAPSADAPRPPLPTDAERIDLLHKAIAILTTPPSSIYDIPDSLLLYAHILRELATIELQGDAAAQARAVKIEQELLELLTPDHKPDFDPEKDDEVKEEGEADKGIAQQAFQQKSAWQRKTVKGWMGDLRFQWARWEVVEIIARREIQAKDAKGPGGGVKWDWEKEWERLKSDVRGSEDKPQTNFKAFLVLLTILELIQRNTPTSSHLPDSRETLWSLVEKYGNKERAPIVALLELDVRLPEVVKAGDEEKFSRVALLKEYFEKFGGKGMALDDLKPYWPRGEQPGAQEGRQFLEEVAAKDATDVDVYCRKLNATKLLRYISPPGNATEELEAGKRFWKMYTEGAVFSKSFPTTDVKPADDYGLMAAQAIIFAATKNDDSLPAEPNAVLLVALLMLEKIQRDSPAFFPAKMLLVRMYRLFGAPSLVPALVDSLKMRTFQQDTVLHVVTERFLTVLMATSEKSRASLEVLMHSMLLTYDEAEHESNEGVANCFMNGTYASVESSLEFQAALRQSHQHSLLEIEGIRQSAARNAQLLVDLDDETVHDAQIMDGQETKDTRDWDLYPDYKSKDEKGGVVELTSMGPLTDHHWMGAMFTSWFKILSLGRTLPTWGSPSSALPNGYEPSHKGCTSAELALFSFASELEKTATGWHAGEAAETGLVAAFQAIASATEPRTYGGWQSIHLWTELVVAYGMYEVAISPLKPRSGKKAKKGGAVNPVHEAIKATSKALQEILRTAGAVAKDEMGKDALLGAALGAEGLVGTMARLGLEDADLAKLSKGIETNIRDSRRTGFRELGAALKRKADS